MGRHRAHKNSDSEAEKEEVADSDQSEASSSDENSKLERKKRKQRKKRKERKRRSPSESDSSDDSSEDSDESESESESDSDESTPKHKRSKRHRKHSAKRKRKAKRREAEAAVTVAVHHEKESGKTHKMRSICLERKAEENQEDMIHDLTINIDRKKESVRRVYIDRPEVKNGDRQVTIQKERVVHEEIYHSRERSDRGFEKQRHDKYPPERNYPVKDRSDFERMDDRPHQKKNLRDFEKNDKVNYRRIEHEHEPEFSRIRPDDYERKNRDDRSDNRSRPLDNDRYQRHEQKQGNGDRRQEFPPHKRNKNQEDRYAERQEHPPRHGEEEYEQKSRNDTYQKNDRGYQSRSNEMRGTQSKEYRDGEDNSHRPPKRRFDERIPEERGGAGAPSRKDTTSNNSNRNIRQRSTERERGPPRDKNPPPSNARRDSSPGNKRRRPQSSKWENEDSYEWGKKDQPNNDNKTDKDKAQKDKEKPNFGLSGKLTEDTNMVNGVVIKYSEPTEGRKPKRRWRFYPFKGDKPLPILYIHRQSYFLLGRDRTVADIPLDHPSISKQHAVLQYRLVPFTRDDGSTGKRVRPYMIDLGSANGTFVNNKPIEAAKYVELLERDVIKFGFSQREYVLLHENSKEDEMDDDVNVAIKTEDDDDVKKIKSEPEDN